MNKVNLSELYPFLSSVGIQPFHMLDREAVLRCIKTLKEVDLVHGAHKRIRTYSKGMLQRLGLAQAMINDPELLLLDEPLDGLDPLGRAEVKKIIKALKAKGKTIFINTHILGDVEEICDSVAIIDQGELVATGSPQELSLGYKDLEDAFVSIITKKRSLA
jgi:ABC-type multidrug transport system ATPase subunit